MVDATLVRYYPGHTNRMLAGQAPAERERVEETLAGFRFVRNQMGREPERLDFIGARRRLATAASGPSQPGRGSRCPSPFLPRFRRAGGRGR